MNQTDKNQASQFMKIRPVLGLLVSIPVPMIISMLIQSLYNIVDSIYMSRLGTQALMAVSLTFPLQNISASVAIGMGVGITPAVSTHLGSGSAEKANRSAIVGVALAVVHHLIFVVLRPPATKPFLMLFIKDERTLIWACQYTYIVVCVSFGCQLQLAMEKIPQAVGSMKITMVPLAVGYIINIILDPVLIFGLLGFLAPGIIGAAAATVIGRIAAFLLYIVVYHHKRETLPVRIHPQYLHSDKTVIRQICSMGTPSIIMLVLPSVLVSVLNGSLTRSSDIYVAVLGAYSKLQTLIYMPASGIVRGMRSIVGYNCGAGKYDWVRKVIRHSLLSAVVTMAVGIVAVLGFPIQIFAMFSAEEALLDAGISALRVISLGFVISTIDVICSGTFEALGRGRDSLIVSLLCQSVITIPLSFLLSSIMGMDGAWLAFPISELCVSVVAWILFRQVPSLG